MSVTLCPMPKLQFFTDTGAVAAGYYLYFYAAGQPGVLKPTYTDSGGGTANDNPMVLNSAGRPDSNVNIWLDGYYIVELWTGEQGVGGSTQVWSVENVGTGDASTTSGTFTGTLVGCTTAPTGTFRYDKTGNTVTMYLPLLTGTSNTVTLSITGLPAIIQPQRTQYVPCRIYNNGSMGSGYVSVDPVNGLLQFYTSAGLGIFSALGNKGTAESTITYSLQ